MKKIIISSTLVLSIIAIVALTFSACKKDCVKCVVSPPDLVKLVTFNLMD